MDEETKKQLAELKNFHDLCKPIVEYLKENFTSNFAVFIANGQANIFCRGDDSNSFECVSVPTKFKFK